MKKIFIYCLFFCVLVGTPGEFTLVSEVFMGSEEGKYYTLMSEILNPGSYYRYKKNTYLVTYKSDNSLITKKILKQENIILDENAKETNGTIKVIKNKGSLEKLLQKNIELSMLTFENDGRYEMREDGIYENLEEKTKEAVRLFSKEEINNKIREICSKDYCGENTDYDNEDLKILSGYYNKSRDFYIISVSLDMGDINFIMRKND